MHFLFEILKSMIYGIIQGITEWLPISSTGHLIILNHYLPLNVFEDAAQNIAFWDMYKVVIQLGSILAVLLLYFHQLNPFEKHSDPKQRIYKVRLWIKILIASIPAAIIGFLLDDYIDEVLSSTLVIATTLIVYGILFIWIENRHKVVITNHLNELGYKKAFQIGMFQMLALIPGTSRSGSTIIGSLLLGTSRPVATEFSFFMAIPVMFGASLLKLIKLDISIGFFGLLVLLAGFIVSFLVSVFAIRELLKYIRRHNFKVFGIYRILLGILLIILTFTKLI